MPANYAHYRFGIQALEQLSPDLKRPIQRFRRMYDVGLHGPDLFFYYNPLMQNSLAALARRTHALAGREFFTQACEILKKNPSEAGQAYLYGLLCHYCLDSALHPWCWRNLPPGISDMWSWRWNLTGFCWKRTEKPHPAPRISAAT